MKSSSRRRKPINKRGRPDIGDLELFVRVCACVEERSNVSLQIIAERVELPISAISQCLRKLEDYYGVSLLARSPRRGVGTLTFEGKRFREQSHAVLREFDSLRALPADPRQSITIAATDTIQKHLLPGALAAHFLRLREAKQDHLVRIRVETGNYPDLIDGLRRGTYAFAIGYDLPSKAYPDVKLQPLLKKRVGVGVIIPHHQVIDRSRNEDLLDLWRANRNAVQFEDLERLIFTKNLVTVRTEHHPDLADLFARANVARLTVVDRSEDVLSHVRTTLADVGWVPLWYQKRQHVLFRHLVRHGKDVTRQVAVYRRLREVQGAVELEPLSTQAESLLRTINEFINDPKHVEKILDGDKILAADICQWVGVPATVEEWPFSDER